MADRRAGWSVIRDATISDVGAVVALGEMFHREAGWPDVFEYSPETARISLSGLVESPDGILLVAEAEGRIVGMAGGLAHPHYLNSAHRTGTELFWWVQPGLRDGTGAVLLDRLEAEARAIGCQSWVMGAVERLHPEALARIYRRRGYRPAERTFIKRLDA